jgi:hypothetical protein
MSRFAHRQPAWGTISIVLLSALFLSPMTGTAFLHALALDASLRAAARPGLARIEEVAVTATAPEAREEHDSVPEEESNTSSASLAATRVGNSSDSAPTGALRWSVSSSSRSAITCRLRMHVGRGDAGSAGTFGDAVFALLPERIVLLVPDSGSRLRPPAGVANPSLPRAMDAGSAAPRAPPSHVA